MGEFLNKLFKPLILNFRNISRLSHFPVVRLSCARAYSQYPPVYCDPLVPKDEVKVVLESEAYKELEQMPVRAALNYYSSSMFLDPQVMLFINHVMDHGRKQKARQQVGFAFTQIKRIQVKKYNMAKPENRDCIELDPVKIFHAALRNARPYLTTTRLRLGAVWYQVPRAITEKKAISTTMKWFVEVSNDKDKNARFYETLAEELILASENKGRVMQKKIELHKLCEANKAYAHFRWG